MATIFGTSGNDNLPRLTDPSTAGDDYIYGLEGNDTINAGSGSDIINGGTGIDSMVGGLGNDGYYVDSSSDVTTEGVGAGIDSVYSYAGSYTLRANVENLYMYGSAYSGYGNALNNSIVGTSGNNLISGGAGVDTAAGGLGSDAYVVDSTSDVVTEGVNAGTDSVYASASYSLGANVENLYLSGTAYYGYGNALNNSIVGNSSNNYLSGGAGVDTMAGGIGSDVYVVDSTSDVVTEGVDAGTDVVYASASYTLGANVENLYLQGSAYYGYGNALNNYIAGNSGNNLIWGGAGNDTMAGSAGNDIYYVDSTSDVIIEGVGAGTDVVYASASYTLGANVENLYLQGSAYYGYGNALNNSIVGNAGNNYLWGGAGNDTITGGVGNDTIRGSVGSDVLTGGAGADYFNFYSTSEGSDSITDFSWGQGDKIALSDSGFGGSLTTTTGVTPGSLLSSQFRTGAGATTSNHRVIYNSSTGALFFDADGTGAAAQVQIASLSTGLALISSDFQVIA
ncbi:calcium-binding protein [Microcoleus sp. FACHB-672]|uniref:calcium-binding protein n=1 Tax=Microcoleus sp. FACHB-672 TaxID=2692825 RepID=UPI0016867C2F|nr:calcium-binding protein [Microcoleus sp. FACHB-672]MBD2042888.1 calcium-binding protein [Microcoleus sp. FACHB-672]